MLLPLEVYWSVSALITGLVLGVSIAWISFKWSREHKEGGGSTARRGLPNDGSSSASSSEYTTESESEGEEYEKYEEMRLKMVFVIRQTSPKLSPATAADLVCRAAIALVEEHLSEKGRDEWLTWYTWWRRIGCAKITLKGGNDESNLQQLKLQAHELGIPVSTMDFSDVLQEAEKYPLKKGTAVIALGPAPSKKLDPVTGKLKLMS